MGHAGEPRHDYSYIATRVAPKEDAHKSLAVQTGQDRDNNAIRTFEHVPPSGSPKADLQLTGQILECHTGALPPSPAAAAAPPCIKHAPRPVEIDS